jgi:hypothetical protein
MPQVSLARPGPAPPDLRAVRAHWARARGGGAAAAAAPLGGRSFALGSKSPATAGGGGPAGGRQALWAGGSEVSHYRMQYDYRII